MIIRDKIRSIGRKKLLLFIGGIAIIIAILLSLNSISKYRYRAIFYEAHGLKKGNKVTMLGIPIGKVYDIKLYEDSVIVLFCIKNIKLRQNATLSLEPLNIFGDKELALHPGQGDYIAPNSVIQGSFRKGLRETIVSIGVFVDHLDSLIREMISLTSDVQKTFNYTAQGLERTITSVEQEAVKTLKDVREITTSTQKILSRTTQDFTTTVENLRDISFALKSFLEVADTSFTVGLQALAHTTTKLDTLTSLLITGKGTAGKLLTDDVLYIKIDSTVSSLKELLNDVKKDPPKYFRFF